MSGRIRPGGRTIHSRVEILVDVLTLLMSEDSKAIQHDSRHQIELRGVFRCKAYGLEAQLQAAGVKILAGTVSWMSGLNVPFGGSMSD